MSFMQMLRLAVAPKTIYQSDAGHIVILDRIEHKRPVRLLLYDGVRESGMYLDENGDTDPLFSYMQSLKESLDTLFPFGVDEPESFFFGYHLKKEHVHLQPLNMLVQNVVEMIRAHG